MAVARVDRAHASSTDLGFRLAPRINAAGRLCHPDQALELLLTADDGRARALAERLEALNRERQAVEDGILRQAVSQVEAADEEWRARRAYVLHDPEWHEGVIGIVASRLVERYARPVVLIAGDGDEAKGSGRSVAAYDLHAGLTATAEHLTRYGGHRVAAGLTMRSGPGRGLLRRRSPTTPARTSPTPTSSAGSASTPSSRRPRRRSSWPTSSTGSSRSASATRA